MTNYWFALIIILIVLLAYIHILHEGYMEGVKNKSKNRNKKSDDKNTMEQPTPDSSASTKGVNDFDIEYHDPPEKILKDDPTNLEMNVTRVFDPSLNKIILIPRPAIQNSVTFYELGQYKYGTSNYIPNYSESILLSHLQNVLPDHNKIGKTNTPEYYNISNKQSTDHTYVTTN